MFVGFASLNPPYELFVPDVYVVILNGTWCLAENSFPYDIM